MTDNLFSRRRFLRTGVAAAAALVLPAPLLGCAREEREEALPPGAAEIAQGPVYDAPTPEDLERLRGWVGAVRAAGLAAPAVPLGLTAAGVGERAIGTPYEAYTLEAYLRAGNSPMRTEPLTLHLDRFDCVSLVESCLAMARVARREGEPEWDGFAREMERMRYRGGEREGYASRLHYFSEWLDDNQQRGLVRILGEELGGVPDRRPLRFMTEHAEAYPALEHPEMVEAIASVERALDGGTRWVIPTERIPRISDQLETGDILAFATSIEGLDVTHSAFAYRDEAGVMRVLHAPLSGGVVEVTESTLPEYVSAIRRATGILVARPLQGA